jgi:hypothetical protein
MEKYKIQFIIKPQSKLLTPFYCDTKHTESNFFLLKQVVYIVTAVF